ncbi:MAG: hypothetical protein NVS2B14_04020 [Chamaesiphon sp.]
MVLVKQESNVAKASSGWQQLVNPIQGSSQAQLKLRVLKPSSLNRFRKSGGWLLALTFVLAMVFWHWKLLLAASVGVLVMLPISLMQEWNWQIYWSSLRQFLKGSNQQLTLAIGSGAIAALSSYMAISIWIDSDSPWIAASAILQGFGTLATLILLVWQIMSRQMNRDEAKLNGILTELTDGNPLKRLIAVRQLTHLVTSDLLEQNKQYQIADYLSLMLNQEQEAIVRNAVRDGLHALENNSKAAIKIRRRSS